MTTPAYASKGTAAYAPIDACFGTIDVTPTLPATINTDDVILLVIRASASGGTGTIDSITIPTTYGTFNSLHTNGMGTGAFVGFYYMVSAAGAGDGAGLTINLTSGGTFGNAFAQFYRITGSGAGLVKTTSGGANSGSSTTPSFTGVTPTSGGLSIGLLSVANSTTVGSVTGESTGDWTEAVAEDSDATPAKMCQIQTAVGTVSGGTCTLGTSSAWRTFSFFVEEKVTATTLLPTKFTNTNTFGSPKIALTVKPTKLTASQTFGTEVLKLTIKPTSLANAHSYGAERIVLTVKPTKHTNTNTTGTTVVLSGYIPKPTLFINAQTFGAPKIIVTLKPTLLTNSQTFGTEVVTVGRVVGPLLFANVQSYGTPKITLTLKPTKLTNTNTFGTEVVGVGYFPRPTLHTNVQTFGSPKILLTLKPTLFVNAQTFGSPSIIDASAIAVERGLFGDDPSEERLTRQERDALKRRLDQRRRRIAAPPQSEIDPTVLAAIRQAVLEGQGAPVQQTPSGPSQLQGMMAEPPPMPEPVNETPWDDYGDAMAAARRALEGQDDDDEALALARAAASM